MRIDMTESKSEKPKVIRADKSLQNKIGTGPLDDKTVKKCQDVMDNNDVDFAPEALDYLSKLGEALTEVKKGELSTKESVESMTAPVMQLKANSSTFGYTLIGSLANVMLSFLEGIKAIDKDVIAIVEAHHKTLTAIVIKKMKGEGGAFGQQMEEELKDACKRYFTKIRAN